MDYTQDEVDRILEASEKATPGPWVIAISAYLLAINNGDNRQIATFDKDDDWEEEQGANRMLCSGALILAEEVKRLREENKRVQSESDYYKAQLGAMYFRPS